MCVCVCVCVCVRAREAAASCKDIAQASVTTWEPRGVKLAGYCYAVRHGMKFIS